jgi:acyl dehydratase
MYLRHIVHQRHALAALSGTALRESRLARSALSLGRERGPERKRGPEIALPGPELTARVSAPPSSLVRDYLLHVGGDPGAYRGVVPPHLFLQWSLPLAARTLRGLPYPLLRIVNAGCRIQVNASLTAGAPLSLRASVQGIDANEQRAVLHQRIVTGSDGAPDALVADLYTVVPISETAARARARGPAGPARGDTRIPDDARELARWSLPRNAGLAFAALTGDFNPIHWAAPYARAFGFPGPILHGFGTLARAWEALVRARFAGAADRLRAVDVRFLRPLPLPAQISLFLAGTHFFVGGAPGARATLAGTFEEASA